MVSHSSRNSTTDWPLAAASSAAWKACRRFLSDSPAQQPGVKQPPGLNSCKDRRTDLMGMSRQHQGRTNAAST